MRQLAPLVLFLLFAAAFCAVGDRIRPHRLHDWRAHLKHAALAFGNELGKAGDDDNPDVPTIEQLKERSIGLRSSALETADRIAEMRAKAADERTDDWSGDLRMSTDELLALDAELRAVDGELDARMRDRIRDASDASGPTAALDDVTEVDRRSAGARVAESDEFRAWVTRSHGSGTSPDIEVRTLLSSESSDPAAGSWLPSGQPYLPAQAVDRRRLFVRQLLAPGQTGLSSIPYIRELNPIANEGGASAVLEGDPKSEVTAQFLPVDAPVRKIAAWIPATTEILEDAPTLRTYIDARLAYMVALREEEEILNGNGTAPHLRGIRQTVGLQTQASVGSGEQAASIGRGIGKIENVDGVADGIAMNPIDYWTMVTTRHANQFDDGFGTLLPFQGAPRGLWGEPVVRTRSMESTKVLVGAYAMGAQLFDRMATVIRIGDQHADYFTNNKVAILGEERVALAVYRPDWFCEVTIAA